MMDKQQSLSKAAKELMLKEPYYGFFLITLNKLWNAKRVPTAGVSKNGINYQLTINEDFWNGLSENHRIGLLKHELLHIVYFHLSSYCNYTDKKLANIAMDMEINQYIDNEFLPDGGIRIEDYPDLNLELKAGTRYYYDKLKQAKDQEDQKGTSGDSNFDKLCDAMDRGDWTVVISGGMGDQDVNLPDHGTWEEFENLSEAEQKIIQKQLDRVLQEVSDQTIKKRGTVPGHITDHLLEVRAKGSIQFPLNKPIPKALVIKMVKYRLSQLQE